MRIKVRLFAVLKERAGVSELELEIPEASTVGTASAALVRQIPSIGEAVKSVAFAVNRTYAPKSTTLHEGDELAIIPPVSGG